MVADALEVLDLRALQLRQPRLETVDPGGLPGQTRFHALLRGQQRIDQFVVVDLGAQLLQEAARHVPVQVGGQPEPEPELGVVLEQRVRPRRPASPGVLRPRGVGRLPP